MFSPVLEEKTGTTSLNLWIIVVYAAKKCCICHSSVQLLVLPTIDAKILHGILRPPFLSSHLKCAEFSQSFVKVH